MGKILPFFHPYFSKWVETTSFVIDEMFSSVPPWEFSLLKNGGKKMENPAKITYMTFKVWMLRHVRWKV